MAALILPTSTQDARYTFDIDLEQVTFTFNFEWNDRDSGWYFSIVDAAGATLIAGRRVVLNYSLLDIYRETRLPAGRLIAIDTSQQDKEPGFGDLGDRVQLIYLPRL